MYLNIKKAPKPAFTGLSWIQFSISEIMSQSSCLPLVSPLCCTMPSWGLFSLIGVKPSPLHPPMYFSESFIFYLFLFLLFSILIYCSNVLFCHYLSVLSSQFPFFLSLLFLFLHIFFLPRCHTSRLVHFCLLIFPLLPWCILHFKSFLSQTHIRTS